MGGGYMMYLHRQARSNETVSVEQRLKNRIAAVVEDAFHGKGSCPSGADSVGHFSVVRLDGTGKVRVIDLNGQLQARDLTPEDAQAYLFKLMK